MKEIKIKLKRILEPEVIDGIVKDVNYSYSIDDSTGLLGLTLTMYNEIDSLEEFLNHVPSMCKYDVPVSYLVYYKNMKYIIVPDNVVNNLIHIQKVKMY